MTSVRIAHTEAWPGRRAGGRGFGFFSMLVVLADDCGGRALPLWLNGPDGHGLFRGRVGLSRLAGGRKPTRQPAP